VYLPISRRYSQITIADLNRDNRPDMVMTDGAAIAVMMNLGNRTLTLKWTSLPDERFLR